uniref:Uncharacterized protein n=1 Tax=Lygus hesperus TaxID=30085 RepID=A0A146M8D0_LYGHE
MTLILQDFIAEMNRLYIQLSHAPLQPKFHYVTHYPRMLLQFGPVVHLWSMRFEGKHRVGKKAAGSTSCRINLCKTVAKKIQLQLNDVFVQNTLRPPVFSTSVGNPVYHSVVDEICGQLPHLPCTSEFSSHSFVSSPLNVTYRRQDVIQIDLDPECMYPVFAQIQELFFERISGECYASVVHFTTEYFDNHYFAYKVSRTNERSIVALKNLTHPLPNTYA